MTLSEYHPGFAIPVWGTASGMIYLTYCSEEEYEGLLQVIRRNSETFRKNWMIDEAYLEGMREQTRKRGYATYAHTQHSLDPGKTSGMAVPLFHEGKLSATLALVFFSSTYTTNQAAEKYLDDLMATRKSISGDLANLKSLEYKMMGFEMQQSPMN